jgi:hypothetical protein
LQRRLPSPAPGQRRIDDLAASIHSSPRQRRLQAAARSIQRSPRVTAQHQQDNRVAQLAPWNAIAAADEANETANQNARLPGPPHPVAIGAQQDPANPLQTQGNQKHFDTEMRDQVRDLLNYLPAEHIVGNPSLARVVCESATPANPGISFYNGGNQTLHVVVPFNVDSWIYLSIDKWPVGDLVTTLMTNVGYSQDPNNPNLGNKTGELLSRDVIGRGSVSSKLSMIGENFVQWMLKHETGHSVDNAIGFIANGHYRQPFAASWMIHDGTDQTEAGLINSFTGGLGLNMGVLNAQYLGATGANFAAVMNNAVVNKQPNAFQVPGRAAALAGYDVAVPGGAAQVKYLEKVISSGLDSPWQLGGEGGVPFGGRNYHVEYQHTRWVSYNAARYPARNSNYQYSGPDEWFAESYAHYFKHSSWKFWRAARSQWGEQLRDPIIRAWFLANLDPINGPGNLIAANVLQPIAGAGPVLAPPAPGAVAVPAQPGRLQKLGRGFVKLTQLGASGLLRILSTVFGIAGGLLKLLYVGARTFWRWLTG